MAIGPLGVHAAHFGKPKNERKPLTTLAAVAFGCRRKTAVEF